MNVNWHLIGNIAFWVAITIGVSTFAAEIVAALVSRDGMERPEFADTQPEPDREVVAAAERILVAAPVRVPRYLEDEDRTDVLSTWQQMEPTEALERWQMPATTYKSGNGGDES